MMLGCLQAPGTMPPPHEYLPAYRFDFALDVGNIATE